MNYAAGKYDYSLMWAGSLFGGKYRNPFHEEKRAASKMTTHRREQMRAGLKSFFGIK